MDVVFSDTRTTVAASAAAQDGGHISRPQRLRTLEFVEKHHHVLLMGPEGVGKTMLAQALGRVAVEARFTVRFLSADALFLLLRASRLDDTYRDELRRLTRYDVLILDDFALRRLTEEETMDMYEIVVARHQVGSMIVTIPLARPPTVPPDSARSHHPSSGRELPPCRGPVLACLRPPGLGGWPARGRWPPVDAPGRYPGWSTPAVSSEPGSRVVRERCAAAPAGLGGVNDRGAQVGQWSWRLTQGGGGATLPGGQAEMLVQSAYCRDLRPSACLKAFAN